MNAFEQFIVALRAGMPQPAPYTWFHIIFLCLTIVSTIVICIIGRNAKAKTVKWFIFAVWITMLILEAYKQVVYSFKPNAEGDYVWKYNWYFFPFQLCSTPLFVLPFVVFCKEGKFRDTMIAYTSTFALFGGLVTMLYPSDAFSTLIGINFQTMIHHGLQIVSGVFLLVHEREKLNFKYFLRGIIVFVIGCAIAMSFNLITRGVTNMFFLGPYIPCPLPLLGDFIYPNVPYVVFLLIYVIGFIIAALLIYYIQYGIIKLCTRLKK